MHPDGWLRRRSTRFHGIKDSALNPRDCRGCVEGREGQREGDRASARSERGQWSRRRKGQAEFWVSGFAPLHEVRRKAALCDECGTVGQRTPWPPRRPTPPRCIHPDAIRTTLRFSLPSLSLSSLPSFVSSSLSLSSCYPLPSGRSHCLTLRYYYYRSRNVVRDWRSFSRFLGGLELYIREEEEEERFYTDDKTKEEVGCLLVSLVRECRWSSRLLTSTTLLTPAVFLALAHRSSVQCLALIVPFCYLGQKHPDVAPTRIT